MLTVLVSPQASHFVLVKLFQKMMWCISSAVHNCVTMVTVHYNCITMVTVHCNCVTIITVHCNCVTMVTVHCNCVTCATYSGAIITVAYLGHTGTRYSEHDSQISHTAQWTWTHACKQIIRLFNSSGKDRCSGWLKLQQYYLWFYWPAYLCKVMQNA